MLTATELTELEAIASKQPLVKKLLDGWRIFYESDYLGSYMMLYNQIKDLEAQLTIQEGTTIKRVVGEDEDGKTIYIDWVPGRIDLFADKDTKDFERGMKFFLELPKLKRNLDDLRGMFTTFEVKNLEHIKKKSKNTMVAV